LTLRTCKSHVHRHHHHHQCMKHISQDIMMKPVCQTVCNR
jgi:hypothetical protein